MESTEEIKAALDSEQQLIAVCIRENRHLSAAAMFGIQSTIKAAIEHIKALEDKRSEVDPFLRIPGRFKIDLRLVTDIAILYRAQHEIVIAWRVLDVHLSPVDKANGFNGLFEPDPITKDARFAQAVISCDSPDLARELREQIIARWKLVRRVPVPKSGVESTPDPEVAKALAGYLAETPDAKAAQKFADQLSVSLDRKMESFPNGFVISNDELNEASKTGYIKPMSPETFKATIDRMDRVSERNYIAERDSLYEAMLRDPVMSTEDIERQHHPEAPTYLDPGDVKPIAWTDEQIRRYREIQSLQPPQLQIMPNPVFQYGIASHYQVPTFTLDAEGVYHAHRPEHAEDARRMTELNQTARKLAQEIAESPTAKTEIHPSGFTVGIKREGCRRCGDESKAPADVCDHCMEEEKS